MSQIKVNNVDKTQEIKVHQHVIKVYPELEDLEVTPSGVEQNFNHPNSYGYDNVKVKAISSEELNIKPSIESQEYIGLYGQVNVSAVDNTIDNNIQENNIKNGISILGVTGNVDELISEEIEITPTTSQQVITPSANKTGITKATVKAVDSTIDNNIQAGNIKSGVSILGVQGNVEELIGEERSVTPSASSQIITPSTGKTGITKVNVSGDNNLVPENIVKDVEIFGVTGTYSEENIVPKDVNFYNPLGELLYSYTTQEALALQQMPEVPTIEGMTTTGWNYSYADMRGQVQSMGVADIGCQYYQTDKTTRFYLNIDNPNYLKPYITVRLYGTITVDWGDGSPTESYTATNTITSAGTTFSHEYATTGNYVIKMHHDTNSTELLLGGSAAGAKYLWDGTNINNYAYRDYLYRLDLYSPESPTSKFSSLVTDARNVKVIYAKQSINITNCFSLLALVQNVPSGWNITAPSAKFCTNLELLLISSSARNMETSNSMRNIGLPNRLIIPYKLFDTTTVRAYTGQFGNDYSIEEIYLPDDYPDINGCFNSCFNLKKVVFGNVTNVGTGTFQNCLCLNDFDFLKCTAVPPLSNVNSFSVANVYMQTPTNRKILVPYNLYATWSTTTNWVSLSDIIYAAGKFNAGATFPTGYTWYKDEKHTIPVTSATAPDTGIYYAEVS